jgi:hypothetical protein
MEQWEFHDMTKATVDRFMPRIPEKYVEGFESALHGGEFGMVVDDLVLTVVKDHVPVTASERDDLCRLLVYLRRPTEILDELTMVRVPELDSRADR